MSTTSRSWRTSSCTAGAPYFASWVGGDEIHFQRGAQVAGPASEPSEDMRYFRVGLRTTGRCPRAHALSRKR